MQAKDITKKLGVPRERIKYYKDNKVFNTENPVVRGKTEYTQNDLKNLQRLVILTKSGLSCSEIHRIQTGEMSLQEMLVEKKEINIINLERLRGSLSLSEELLERDVQYETMEIEELWDFIQSKENAGEEFMDVDESYYPIPLIRNIQCPYCNENFEVDLEDFLSDQSNDERDNGMGTDLVYSFDSEDNYVCPACGRNIRIEGWIREYPAGTYDSESLKILKKED